MEGKDTFLRKAYKVWTLSSNLSGITKEAHLEKWEEFCWNENKQRAEQKLLNIRSIPQEVTLLHPHWVMDRLKEALNQYVRGEWLSSIALCGSIIEFLLNGLFYAYKEVGKIPMGIQSSDRPSENLEKLRNYGVLDEKDYEQLDEIRRIRNDYVHPEKRLGQKYVEQLKSDNLKVLKNLLNFLRQENMHPKFDEYLRYLVRIAFGKQ